MIPATYGTYREPLPPDCPPATSEEIVRERHVFRLVRTVPPTDRDFRSHRAENPDRIFVGVSECRARGLSVFAARQHAENALRLPTLRGRFLCRLQLRAGAGRIQQTGRGSHHTWWPLADYDILANCEVSRAK